MKPSGYNESQLLNLNELPKPVYLLLESGTHTHKYI